MRVEEMYCVALVENEKEEKGDSTREAHAARMFSAEAAVPRAAQRQENPTVSGLRLV